MSTPLNSHDTGNVGWNVPGLGIMIAQYATTTAAGTVGFAPGAMLLTTTTNKIYVNTGTFAAATWTVAGSQS